MSDFPYRDLESNSNAKGQEFVNALWELAKALKADPDPDYRNILLTEIHTWAIKMQHDLDDLFGLTGEQANEIIRQEYAYRRLYTLVDMPYKEYLQTPEWKERRQRILERDGYRCQVCNSPHRLNVHHRDYRRRGYENDADLTTLCQRCHQVFHENSRLVRVEA